MATQNQQPVKVDQAAVNKKTKAKKKSLKGVTSGFVTILASFNNTMITISDKQGNTIVLTTHILEMAERLAERISIIQKGKIIAQGTLDELRERAATKVAPGQSATLEDVFLELTAEPSASPVQAAP